MINIFSKNAFARHMRGGDSRRFGIDLKRNRETILEAAANVAATGSFNFSIFHRTKIKTRNCISLKGYSENLILRSVSKYLLRRHFIVPKSRDRIVKEVIETLCDSTPMHIIRRDISSFYESLPIKEARKILINDAFIPSRTRKCLEAFFTTFCHSDYGVPRGSGLSAVLAEIAMQSFDQAVRNIEGVYKYFRYSDDILIFSYLPVTEVSSKVESVLPIGLSFNPRKLDDVPVFNTNKNNKKIKSIEYLGYKFLFTDYCGDNKPRIVNVSIAERKIQKLKSKIILALKKFIKDGNFDILHDRMRFIASNYYAYRRGTSTVKHSMYVKSGIYYNYHLCGTYAGERRKVHKCAELKRLDAFYQYLLFGNSSEFSTAVRALPPDKIEKIRGISFYKGYENKITVKFSTTKVQSIKEAWRNA